jgi:hypothetical protein
MMIPALKAPVFRFRFRNPAPSALNLWIEPLGDCVMIPEQTTVEVHCTEQLGYPNEVEMSQDGIIIHGWVQSVSAVTEGGELRPLWKLPEDI